MQSKNINILIFKERDSKIRKQAPCIIWKSSGSVENALIVTFYGFWLVINSH
jgi:hypothetical protein